MSEQTKRCRACGALGGLVGDLDADGYCADEGPCLARSRRRSSKPAPPGVPMSWPWRIALSLGAWLAELAHDREVAGVLGRMLADDAAVRWPR